MRSRGPGVNQFTELEIHREYGGHQGYVTGQGVSLNGCQTLDDGGVEGEQGVVMDGQQEAELRVSLDRHGETGGSHAGQPGHVTGGHPGLLANERRVLRVLTNERRVLRVLTNERRVLRVLTNERPVLPGVVIGGVLLARQKLLRVEQLPVHSGPHLRLVNG